MRRVWSRLRVTIRFVSPSPFLFGRLLEWSLARFALLSSTAGSRTRTSILDYPHCITFTFLFLFDPNSAVWLNLLLIFISMGVAAHTPPNFASAKAAYGSDVASGPIHTAAIVSLPLFSKINGIMQMVFAYGGAMIFPEFMAEMRRPMDFWKAMVSKSYYSLIKIEPVYSIALLYLTSRLRNRSDSVLLNCLSQQST